MEEQSHPDQIDIKIWDPDRKSTFLILYHDDLR